MLFSFLKCGIIVQCLPTNQSSPLHKGHKINLRGREKIHGKKIKQISYFSVFSLYNTWEMMELLEKFRFNNVLYLIRLLHLSENVIERNY